MKHTKKSSKWDKLPFKLGESGSIFQPSTFGDKQGTGPTWTPEQQEGISSGKKYKKGKK